MKGFVPSRLHPILALLLLVGLMFLCFCLASFVLMLLTGALFGIGLMEFGQVMQNPARHPQGWAMMMLAQGIFLLGGFAGAALALVRIQGQSWRAYFAPRHPVPARWLLLGAVLIVVMLPAMSGLVQWNADIHFPRFLHEFEVWARDKETQAQDLTRFLTQFENSTRLLIGLLVIAVVPAISEELVFRGVLQRQLTRWFGSYHTAIWLSAIIFSAIHLQFFGFVPRMVLGVVLGYLYAWSGNILVPMAAHFTQNAVQLVLLYLQQRGTLATSFDPDSTDALPWPAMLISALLSGGLLVLAYRHFNQDLAPKVMHTLSHDGVQIGGTVPPAGHTLTGHGIEPTPGKQLPSG
ncbi:CPBP family intramembrane glutamic endopeptidase [Hymenobacter sp. BT730]|uniref:CPBP family intramembrane glutamic endopeptidase n=1 Tax=Hymenobacter sp. BT730 TaxID=3063332 RepID=UPI0026DFF84D|nr:CPBP family intramembrane glutamic endopeptidase [Hymenobacter sp. BT730]